MIKDNYFLIVVSLIALIIYGVCAGAFILMKVWAWFVMPLFDGVPMLTFSQAIGMNIIFSLFKYVAYDKKYDMEMEILSAAITAPWILLLILWVIHLLVDLTPVFYL